MKSTVTYSASEDLSIEAKVEGILSETGGLSQMVNPGSLVLIKPNFVAPFPHATTSLEVLEAVIRAVRRCGGDPVIAESSGYEFNTEATFKILGVREFEKRTRTAVVNLDTCEFTRARIGPGISGEVLIPKLVQEADVLINVPKLKRHSVTGVTCGMKNLFGFLHRESRRKIHSIGLDRAITALARFIPCDLVLVDGLTVTERAVFGARHRMNLICGGRDIYAVDLFACGLLGVDPRRVGHIRMALGRGMARHNYRLACLDPEESGGKLPDGLQIQRDSFRKRVLPWGYRMMYALDGGYAAVTKGGSIVPWVHFYFGIRPKLDRKKCTGCLQCVETCPVGAIGMPEKRINADLCMKVRCLKCADVCPESAIRIIGRETGGVSA